MVITLKDKSVITLFDSIEAREIIGEELYDFILKEKENNYKEDVYEKNVVIDDLYSEINSLEDIIDSAYNCLDDELVELINIRESMKYKSINEDEVLHRITASIENLKAILNTLE